MWSIRPRAEAKTPDAFGPGAYVLDRDKAFHPFAPAPLTTAGWRVGHLVSMFAGRHHWTFGAQDTEPDLLVDFVPTTALVDQLWAQVDLWVNDVEALDAPQLDEIGYSQYPDGLDRDVPFITIVR